MSDEIEYVEYKDETMLKDIMTLVSRDLSEPYSIFTYRYFLHNWPKLCLCVYGKDPDNGVRIMIGTIVSKAEQEHGVMQGYIAMLAVDSRFRGKGIGTTLAQRNIESIIAAGCEEIVLETEASNTGALSLYRRLGFFREERMTKYYLNGGDAFRLKMFTEVSTEQTEEQRVEEGVKDGVQSEEQQIESAIERLKIES